MAARTAAERRADAQHRLATTIVELVELAGVSASPSTIRHQLAASFGSELSQSAVDRLSRDLRHRLARIRAGEVI